MTYCVAWQTRGTAFLIADAAKTSNAKPTSDYSTFGELQQFERGIAVEEAALKIFRWPKLAVTCAGHVDAIYKFIWEIDRFISRGYLPWAALAAAQIAKPDAGQIVHAVAATRVFGGTRLLHLRSGGEWRLVKVGEVVHLGSPADSIKQFVEVAITESVSICAEPRAQLASILATCQSLTVHEHLMAQGAGGAFTGIMVDRNGTHWQPDIAYLVVSPDIVAAPDHKLTPTREGLHVSCVVRDNILFISSTTKKGAIAFMTTTQPGIPHDARVRLKTAFSEARLARDSCRYDYVSLISTKWPLTAIVEMKGRSEGPYLRLSYNNLPGDERALMIELEHRVGRFLAGEAYPNGPQICFFYDDTLSAAA